MTVKGFLLWRRQDLNLRPSGYEPDELPTAPLRDLAGAKVRKTCLDYARIFEIK